MFRLLQRTDDSNPRPAEGGGGAALRLLTPVTVLAEADESPSQAVENWSRGLEWVHWLFSSVRNRMAGLYLEADFNESRQRLDLLAPHLIRSWQSAEAGDSSALLQLDRELAALLPAPVNARSAKAGELLLRSTRGARYQGVLGRFRKACEDGTTPGHFLTVWAAVGHFFQLSVSNVVAEYLRLEQAMLPARSPSRQDSEIVAHLTSELLKSSAAVLQLLRAEDAPPATADRLYTSRT